MPKHRPNIERLSAPALIGELAEHIRLGKVKVSEALVAAGIPKIKLQNAPSGGDITLFYDGDIAALSSIACRKYRQLARDLDFALPSFELSWDDVPLNYYTRTIDALPYKDFMCVVSTPDTDRIYHFSGSANGSCHVLGFEKQTGDWTMLPCDLLIAEDLTFKIPSIHDGVDHWWSQSQLALELLAIINAPTKTISLPPLDERTRRMNDQRRLRNSRLIKQTHKIILHKVVVKADGLPYSADADNGTRKVAHDRREHRRWLKKAQKFIRVKASKVNGGAVHPQEYKVVVRKPESNPIP